LNDLQPCPVDLHVKYEWYGDSCVMHFAPPYIPVCESHVPFVRKFANYYEWVSLPDERTERNKQIRPRVRLAKKRARTIVYKPNPNRVNPETGRLEKIDRFWSSRAHRIMPPPVWAGEQRPFAARGVYCRSHYPAVDYLAHLCRNLGYSITAAIAAVAVSTSQITVDRRQSGGQQIDTKTVPKRKIADPEHPYISSSPTRRTYAGGGITVTVASRKLTKHNWTLPMQEGVIDVIVRRRPPKLIAQQRQLNYQSLKRNASTIRAEIRQDSQADLHASKV